jgi:hypothetical protein
LKNIILHVGGPKCASSSIQHYCHEHLSGIARGKDNEKISYFRIVVLPENKIGFTNARDTFPGTSASGDFYHFKGSLEEVFSRIDQQTDHETTVVLSCEGWAYSSLVDSSILVELDKLRHGISVFLVTRPILAVLNSGWLQWGAFSGKSIREWVKFKIQQDPNQFDFFSQYECFSSLKNIREIVVTDVFNDPLRKFQDFLNMPELSVPRINEATHTGLFFSIYRNQESLGRSAHNNQIEKILNQNLHLPKNNTPFFIPVDLVEECNQRHFKQSQKLLELLEKNGNKCIKRDVYLGTDKMFRSPRDWDSGETRQELIELNAAWVDLFGKQLAVRA